MRKLLISLLILSYAGSICAKIPSLRDSQLTQKTQRATFDQVKPGATMINGNNVATPFMAKKK